MRGKPAVKYLEIGNEPYLGLPAGPIVGSCGRPSQFVQDERWDGATRIPTTAADYAAELAATAAKVRAASTVAAHRRAGDVAVRRHVRRHDAVGDVDALRRRRSLERAPPADARDAFDFFILHPYDFTVDDDARIRLAERARKTVRDLRAAAPEKGVAITEYGFLFGGGTLLNALVTADMTRMAIEEQLVMTAPHPHRDRPAGSVRRLGRDRPVAGQKAGLRRPRSWCAALPVALPAAAGALDRRRHPGRAAPRATPRRVTLAVLVVDRRTDDGRRATCAWRCRAAARVPPRR